MSVHGILPIGHDGARSLTYCGIKPRDGEPYTSFPAGVTCPTCIAQMTRRGILPSEPVQVDQPQTVKLTIDGELSKLIANAVLNDTETHLLVECPGHRALLSIMPNPVI